MTRRLHWRLLTLRSFAPEERIVSRFVGTEQRDELIRRVDIDDAARAAGLDPALTVCVAISYAGCGTLEELNMDMPDEA